MKFTASLLSTDVNKTAQYAITFGPATIHVDVHPNGTADATNFTPKAAEIIARELTARYVKANGVWPQIHRF